MKKWLALAGAVVIAVAAAGIYFADVFPGSMRQVVDNLYDADEDDVYAMAVWLAAITPEVDTDARAARLAVIAALDLPEDFDPAFPGSGAPETVLQGAAVFKASCVKCRKERISENQPISLGLTYAVNAEAPTNVFNAVVHGIQPGFGSPTRKMEPVAMTANASSVICPTMKPVELAPGAR